MKGLFSIRVKFLAVMSALLMACVVVYLLIAVKVFRTDKTELVFDLNRSMVSNLSTEIETQFSGISSKFKLFALFSTNNSTKFLVENIFSDSEVVFASLYRQDQNLPFKKYTDSKYLETYGLKSEFFENEINQQRPIPFSEIVREGEHFWNATIEGGTPLIGYGRSVVVEDSKGIPLEHLAVIGYMKPDKILKSLSLVDLSEIFVVDKSGKVLIHQNPKFMSSQRSFHDNPLFEAAKKSPVAVSVLSLKENGEEFLGAFAKSYQDKILVLARSPENKAFVAVQELVSNSLLFASIVITVSLLFAFLLSKSLTEPISILADGMEKVSAGDLSTQIHVNSRDETQLLANSFNQMIRDLRQSRDELQEINRELDQKVKDRTRQLEIQNLAVKEAQEALLRTTRLASAGEIAGRAAHEVLNPLTGILTRLNGIEKRIRAEVHPQISMMKDIFNSWKNDQSTGGFDQLVKSWKSMSTVEPGISLWEEDLSNLESVRDRFQILFDSFEKDTQFLLHEGGRINKIINGMRKLSHLNSDVQSHSAKKLINDCKNIMADLFSETHIKITENYASGNDEIRIDRDEFIQAMTNLMRNSLQAMKSPDLKQNYQLNLKTIFENEKVIIEITDNGSGVPEKYQPMLFETQFTTKSPDEGTGLGLGISRRFMRAHGGDIEFVSSFPFKETKFRIKLPLSAVSVESAEEGAA